RLICTQAGSPLPSIISFSNLIRGGTAFTSTRVTEGFASGLVSQSEAAAAGAQYGSRVMVKYSGFTPVSRLFVPDAIAGVDAAQPAAVGVFVFIPAGGTYTPGRGELLLIRVSGADAGGAGGTLSFPVPATGPTSFDSVSEVSLSHGAGYAVYEVVDGNPF